jgi:hypothetical protein
MNNHAPLAALGAEAVAAVNGYRLAVLAEAERRRLCLVADAPPADPQVGSGPSAHGTAIDIRLAFVHCPGRPELAGRTLRWEPAWGWSMSHRLANRPLCFYARSVREPLQLVPTPPELLDWAVADPAGTACPPVGVRLDEGPDAITQLLTFIEPDPRYPPCTVSGPTNVEE